MAFESLTNIGSGCFLKFTQPLVLNNTVAMQCLTWQGVLAVVGLLYVVLNWEGIKKFKREDVNTILYGLAILAFILYLRGGL